MKISNRGNGTKVNKLNDSVCGICSKPIEYIQQHLLIHLYIQQTKLFSFISVYLTDVPSRPLSFATNF